MYYIGTWLDRGSIRKICTCLVFLLMANRGCNDLVPDNLYDPNIWGCSVPDSGRCYGFGSMRCYCMFKTVDDVIFMPCKMLCSCQW